MYTITDLEYKNISLGRHYEKILISHSDTAPQSFLLLNHLLDRLCSYSMWLAHDLYISNAAVRLVHAAVPSRARNPCACSNPYDK